jgi:hypothetical protein
MMITSTISQCQMLKEPMTYSHVTECGLHRAARHDGRAR